MKKTYLSIFVLLALLLSGTVSAQSASSTTDRINELKQKIEVARQVVQEEKNSIKEESVLLNQKIRNIIQERINKKLDDQKIKVAGPFEVSIQNLKDLISRIESRISKMDANGLDTTNSKVLLEKSKINLEASETELTTLENLLSSNIPVVSTSTKNTERRVLLERIKLQSEKTRQSIKNTHKSIVDVIVSLKPGLAKEEVSTTTNN